ncbi:MAG TPA: hypothetical protein PLX16_07135, partial [Exilispira sp.]|nr:hypothetical protein [Exilispira sp.]
DILIYKKFHGADIISSCSQSLYHSCIRPGLSLSNARKFAPFAFSRSYEEFALPHEQIIHNVLKLMQNYAPATFLLPEISFHEEVEDSFSIIADFSGCQYTYKPIYLFLNKLFTDVSTSISSSVARIPITYYLSPSVSLAIFAPNFVKPSFKKNKIFSFLTPKNFYQYLKLSSIIFPISFFEESGFYDISMLSGFPLTFIEELTLLAVQSSTRAQLTRLKNRLKPVTPILSNSSLECFADLFLANVIQKVFTGNFKKNDEIAILFYPSTNDRNKIYLELKKQLLIHIKDLRCFFSNDDNNLHTSLFITVFYSNGMADSFNLKSSNESLLAEITGISKNISSKIKGKSSVNAINIMFSTSDTSNLLSFDTPDTALFLPEDAKKSNDTKLNEKLLILFQRLNEKFGDTKIHLAG